MHKKKSAWRWSEDTKALQTEPLLIKTQYIMKSFSQKLSFWRVFQSLGFLTLICFAFILSFMLPFGSACSFGRVSLGGRTGQEQCLAFHQNIFTELQNTLWDGFRWQIREDLFKMRVSFSSLFICCVCILTGGLYASPAGLSLWETHHSVTLNNPWCDSIFSGFKYPWDEG